MEKKRRRDRGGSVSKFAFIYTFFAKIEFLFWVDTNGPDKMIVAPFYR